MKRPIILAGVALAALAPQASANVVPTCDAVDLVTFVPGRAITGTLTVSVDGVPRAPQALTFTGPRLLVPIAPATDGQRVVATFTSAGESWTGEAVVSCPLLPPAPTPPDATPNPPAPVPPVVVAVPPRITPPIVIRKDPRKVKVTCAVLNARRAGIREYTRRGFYFRCKAPRARVVPRPAVTG